MRGSASNFGLHAFAWPLTRNSPRTEHTAFQTRPEAGVPERTRNDLYQPGGIVTRPLPISKAAAAIGKLDGYKDYEIEEADMERQWPQLKRQFLIDRDGVVRWTRSGSFQNAKSQRQSWAERAAESSMRTLYS
jgi:hypothetical protein